MEEAFNFVCNSKDCNQKAFLDEKQLISHKRKHDMVLCLNKPSQYSSDQTPTPTRFIRNCEAIGLFQDLQNVNPFDENFKKAAEAVKKGERVWIPSASTLGKAAGEDLHTPHVDLTDDTQSSNNGNEEEEEEEVECVVRTEADTSLRTSSVIPEAMILPLAEVGKRAPRPPSQQDLLLFVKMPDGALVQIPTIAGSHAVTNNTSNTTGAVIIPTQIVQNGVTKPQDLQPKPLPTSAASAVVKEKLKAALMKTSKFSGGGTKTKMGNPPAVSISTNNSTAEARKDKKVSSSTSVDEDSERKRKTLERNRIAAMRCREKRKKWVAELRDKYEKMCTTNEALVQTNEALVQTNEALVQEIAFLRSEVARLKGLIVTSYNQNQVQDLTSPTVQFVSSLPTKKRLTRNSQTNIKEKVELPSENLETNLCVSGRNAREGLRLDIEGATRATVMDLDSPLVRRDEILSSVAPPTTPNERLISFPELDRVGDNEVSEEKMLTTVIQINPNALSKLPSAFS